MLKYGFPGKVFSMLYKNSIFVALESAEPRFLYDLLLCYIRYIQFLQPIQDMVGSVQGCWGFNVQIYLNIDLLQQSVCTLCTVDQESFLIKNII